MTRVADVPIRTALLLKLASRMAPSLQAIGAGGVGEDLSVAGPFKAVSVVQTVQGSKLDAGVGELITHKARWAVFCCVTTCGVQMKPLANNEKMLLFTWLTYVVLAREPVVAIPTLFAIRLVRAPDISKKQASLFA